MNATYETKKPWGEFTADEDDGGQTGAEAPPPEPETTTGSTGAGSSTSEQWTLPLPLPNDVLPPVLRYTPDMIPESLRPWLEDVAERGNFLFDYLAVTSIAGLGAAVGTKCVVYPKQFDDEWAEVPNLWGAIVGRPGMMKSPTMQDALRPLHHVARAWQDRHAEELKGFARNKEKRAALDSVRKSEVRKSATNAFRQGRNDFDLPDELGDAEHEPTLRRLITSDATSAKLGELLAQNPQGMLLELDELAALFAFMENDSGLREFLLKCWSGRGSHNVDRVGRGEIYVPRACVSVFGGIQPGRIAPIVRRAIRGGVGSDGFLARFQLPAYPDGWDKDFKITDRPSNRAARELAEAVYSCLANADTNQFPTPFSGREPGLQFSAGAQPHFFAWLEELEERVRSGQETDVLTEVLNKFRKLVPALALLFELADDPGAAEIGEPALAMALRWADVSETHQRRLYNSGNDDLQSAKKIMERLRKGDLSADRFSARCIERKGWSGLTDRDTIVAAIDLLEGHYWLIPDHRGTGPKGGRPTTWFRPNPMTDGLTL